jgi:hypothetical protein
MHIFYGEELLAQRQTPKLKDHPLLAAGGCLFIVFEPTLHSWRQFSSIHNLRTHHAVVTRDPLNMIYETKPVT